MTPLQAPTIGSDSASPESSRGSANGAKSAGILIVEDEYLIALEVENRLIDAGFNVMGIAATADEAISIAASTKPALAIMDIRLSGPKDGVEAAIELFTILGVRSIFASAHADAQTRDRAAEASPIGWLQKPYSALALIEMITRYLS